MWREKHDASRLYELQHAPVNFVRKIERNWRRQTVEHEINDIPSSSASINYTAILSNLLASNERRVHDARASNGLSSNQRFVERHLVQI